MAPKHHDEQYKGDKKMICAICGLDITKVPNVYNSEKKESYHHTCWYLSSQGKGGV